jgi:hypothetical protein
MRLFVWPFMTHPHPDPPLEGEGIDPPILSLTLPLKGREYSAFDRPSPFKGEIGRGMGLYNWLPYLHPTVTRPLKGRELIHPSPP